MGQRKGLVRAVTECEVRGSGGEGEHAVLVAGRGVGIGWKDVSGKHGGVVGDGTSRSECMEGRVDRMGDGGGSSGAEGAVGVDCESRCAPGASRVASRGLLTEQAVASVEKPVEQALLFATAEDTVVGVGEWREGADSGGVSAVSPFAVEEVCARGCDGGRSRRGRTRLRSRACTISISTARNDRKDAPPMIATVVLLYTDGTSSAVVKRWQWKSAA